jgi:hypothetical protein
MADRKKQEVNAERDRRVAKGFTFEGKLYQSRVEDQKRIANAATQAVAAVAAGSQPGDYRWHGGTKDFGWLASDNTLTLMDAKTVIAFHKAATDWETQHVFAARAIKSTNPVPPKANAASAATAVEAIPSAAKCPIPMTICALCLAH